MEMTSEKLMSIQMQVLDVCRDNGMMASDILSLLTLMLGRAIQAASLGDKQIEAHLTQCAFEGLLEIVTEEG